MSEKVKFEEPRAGRFVIKDEKGNTLGGEAAPVLGVRCSDAVNWDLVPVADSRYQLVHVGSKPPAALSFLWGKRGTAKVFPLNKDDLSSAHQQAWEFRPNLKIQGQYSIHSCWDLDGEGHELNGNFLGGSSENMFLNLESGAPTRFWKLYDLEAKKRAAAEKKKKAEAQKKAEARKKAEAEAQAKAEAEAAIAAEVEAKAKAEDEARIRTEAESKAQIVAEVEANDEKIAVEAPAGEEAKAEAEAMETARRDAEADAEVNGQDFQNIADVDAEGKGELHTAEAELFPRVKQNDEGLRSSHLGLFTCCTRPQKGDDDGGDALASYEF